MSATQRAWVATRATQEIGSCGRTCTRTRAGATDRARATNSARDVRDFAVRSQRSHAHRSHAITRTRRRRARTWSDLAGRHTSQRCDSKRGARRTTSRDAPHVDTPTSRLRCSAFTRRATHRAGSTQTHHTTRAEVTARSAPRLRFETRVPPCPSLRRHTPRGRTHHKLRG
jgi:hypothetical protein